MKIIGQSKIGYDTAYVAVLTENEAAQILGYAYASSMPAPARALITPDGEIQVNDMYQAARSICELGDSLTKSIETHKRLVSNLEKLTTTLAPAVASVKAKIK